MSSAATVLSVKKYRSSARWWESIPEKRKRQLAREIEREKREGAAWRKANKSLPAEDGRRLPGEDAGRQSTDIQPYGFFADEIVRIDPEKDYSEYDTDDFTQMADAVEDAAEEVIEMKKEEGESEEESEVDPLLVERLDILEPEITFEWIDIDDEVLEDVASSFTETLNLAIWEYSQPQEGHRTANVKRNDEPSSGTCASSWRRVMQHAALGWKWDATKDKFVRFQTRGDKEKPPEFSYHRTTRKVRDVVSGQILDMQVLNFSSNDVVDSMRRRWANNSKIAFTIFDLTIEQAGLVQPIKVSCPAGEMRQYSRDTQRALKQFTKGQWRQASAYLKEHVRERGRGLGWNNSYRQWLWESGYDANAPL